MLAKQLIMAIDDLIKSNPDGINQYTAGGGSNDKADAANAKTLSDQHQTSSDFHDERAADARQNANYVLANAHQAASDHHSAASNSFATAAKLYDTSNADASSICCILSDAIVNAPAIVLAISISVKPLLMPPDPQCKLTDIFPLKSWSTDTEHILDDQWVGAL